MQCQVVLGTVSTLSTPRVYVHKYVHIQYVSLAAFALLQQLNNFVLKYMKVIDSGLNFVKNIARKKLTNYLFFPFLVGTSIGLFVGRVVGNALIFCCMVLRGEKVSGITTECVYQRVKLYNKAETKRKSENIDKERHSQNRG